MMKRNILLVCSIVAILFGYSCSSDDNTVAPDDNNTTEEATLVGNWQIETINYSHVEEVDHPIYKNDFCVMEYVTGYSFQEDGSFLYLLYQDKFGTNESDREIWTWEGDTSSFVINQLNPSFPPGYNFGLEPYNVNIESVDGEWIMTFDADLFMESKASFTLRKTDEINTEIQPIQTDQGEPREACKLLG